MLHNKRPPVSLESDQAVNELYSYFHDKDLNPFFLKRIVHPILSRFYDLTVDFEGDSQAVLKDHFAAGGQVIMAMKHKSLHDPLVTAALASRHEALKPMVANTVIPAKEELFGLPVIGWIVSNGGAIPTIRPKGVKKIKSAGTPEEIETRRLRAGEALVDLSIAKYNRGYNVLIYPEGERPPRPGAGETDHAATNLLKLKSGTGRIACGVDRLENGLVVPVAINYQNGFRHPAVALAQPRPIAATPEVVMAEIAIDLKRCSERTLELAA